MIRSSGLEASLSLIPRSLLVLGFDSFTLMGVEIHPRLDYYADFGEGVSIDVALQFIGAWPRDLWIEVVLGEEL